MTEEEFEQLQAALVASMGQNEDIIVGDEEDDGDEQQNAPGYIQQIMGMFGGGGLQSQDQEENKDQEEDKDGQ